MEPTRTRSRTVAPSAAERPRTGQQTPTATRGRPRTRTRLSRNREEEVRDAAVHNGTRLSGTLAPDARAAPVAPLWETEPANDARRRWEDSIEDRVQQSNNLLQQMHQMMSDRFAGDNVAHGGDNLVNDDVPPFPQMSHVTAMGQLEGDVAPVESTVPRVTASGLGAPWPSANGFETGVGGVLGRLPLGAQDRVRAFTSSSLSLHAHVPDKMRAMVWAGEFVELASLLPQRKTAPQELALGLQTGMEEGTSVVCVGPKARPAITSFPLWSRAFQIYMSIYLTQPIHYPEAPAMLKYIQTIRDLSERGSNWQGYDESFRALRVLHSWGWDTVESELWLQAGRTVGLPYSGAPFQSKGVARRPVQQSNNPCFAFNKGLQCDSHRCRYQHKCRRCGAGHPATQCPRFRQASIGVFPAIAQRNLRQ